MLLDTRQNAFRKLHSTETTVISLFEDLLNSLDNGKHIELRLIDLSFAFDTLRQDILLEILRNIGITDKTMEWFSNLIKDNNYSIKLRKRYLSRIKTLTLSPLYIYIYIYIYYYYYYYYLLLSDLGNARVIIEAVLLIETITPLLT